MASRTGPPASEPTRPRRKNVLPRSEIPAGDCLCDHCAGKCCRYFSLPIETPTDRAGYDTFRRYLTHGRTLIYLEERTWFLVVMTRCGYLDAADRCKIYLDRPKICRTYTTAECEYDDDWIFEKVFETPEQVDEYAEAVLPPPRKAEAPAATRPADPGAGRYFSVPIETPTAWDDYDAIRWYLAHGQTLIYAARGTWHLVVATDRRLGEADRAAIRLGPRGIEEDGPAFEKVFETPAQLWEYAEAVLPRRKRPRRIEPALTVISPPA